MTPLVAFCAFDPLFAAAVSLLDSPEQYKHSAPLSELNWTELNWSPAVSMRQGSLMAMTHMLSFYPHLPPTTINWNICVSRKVPVCLSICLSLLLQQQTYSGRRFPLTSLSSLICSKCFSVKRARQKSCRSSAGVLKLCRLFLFRAKDIRNRTNVKGHNNSASVA